MNFMINLNQWLGRIPIHWVLIGSITIILISIEAGFRLGKYRSSSPSHAKEATVGTLVGAMLGLLAFILAFTFGMAGSHFEARRNVVLKESNAIGTAYIRADFLPELERSQVRSLFREYVNVRVEGIKTGKIDEVIKRSEVLQNALWAQAVTLSEQAAGKVFWGLFVQSLNEVIDIHEERMMEGIQKRIPGIIWMMLYAVTIFSMISVGYQFGLTGVRSMLEIFMVAITFSAVLALIADIDNPREGLVKTSQWSMTELQKKLNSEPGLPPRPQLIRLQES